jgi:hypothetical protein
MSSISALLIDAPVGRHFAQLHRDAQERAESVSLYVETGLRHKNGVVVIVAPDSREQILARLRVAGLDAEACQRTGQFVLLDADATLRLFMVDGMPDWDRFRRAVGGVLARLQEFGSSIRAYGEMVNLLWQRGSHKAAIQLEEYWNDLARLHPFALFCTYMMDSQSDATYACPLHDIGRTHSDVIETEDDARFHAAIDEAAREVFGLPTAQLIALRKGNWDLGTSRLPPAQRLMLWIMRNMPGSSEEVLKSARRHYAKALVRATA